MSEVFTYNSDMKPQYYEGFFKFKSLFPDLLPTISLKIHCDDPEIDPKIITRIKNAAYREYAEIMKERQDAIHEYRKEVEEHGTLEGNDSRTAADQA